MSRQIVAGAIEIMDLAIPNHAEVLREIIQTAQWNPARVGNKEHNERDVDLRDSDVCWINPFNFHTPLVLFQFVKQVWMYLDDYGRRYDRSFSGLETVNVNRYKSGQQYHVHADSTGKCTRVISALVYLNDDFDEGETEFVHFGERITPKAGRLLIFPSNYAYAHAALPPRNGVKYSAAFWTVA